MTDGFLAAAVLLGDTAVAHYLRFSRYGYAAVSAAHIFGIALLVGAVLPLDLKLLGFWKSADRLSLVRVLVPTAATGLVIAIASGVLLFSVQPADYLALPVFLAKMGIVAAGIVTALTLHARHGLWLERSAQEKRFWLPGLSILWWLSALVCGRLIAFAG
ncbi:DUF2214 domain-containing protein [Rhodobium gokarnense]|uniref:DUF2214 domain-containing protein n=1 Tax=Rhodobium gokarnense TaxID=364296 RepID=A0ABT3HHQ6_9HYPH|nr:DUF2214 domain-containing protein [Rhodobium gokarnense]MCW2309942.1 hypothetical protein [Rhodobium gokarnense]